MSFTVIRPSERLVTELAGKFLFVGVFAADVALFLVFAEEGVAAVFADVFFDAVGVAGVWGWAVGHGYGGGLADGGGVGGFGVDYFVLFCVDWLHLRCQLPKFLLLIFQALT